MTALLQYDDAPDDEWRNALDAKAAGRELRRSARWVREKWASGELPVSFRVGRTRYVSREALRAYLRGDWTPDQP